INPRLSFFNLNELPSMACNSSGQCVTGGTGASCTTSANCAIKKAPGVYFNKSSDCSDDKVQPNISSVPDLGPLKNKINSVGIQQDADTESYYITILYDNTNFWGKCQYITTTDPNSSDQTCQTVSPFAASVSVYPYDFDPNGGGVFFYRKSYGSFNGGGGQYIVDNSEINGIYVKRLEDLKFEGVPEEEQDCVQYDEDGKCAKDGRRPPSLAGENISSIRINGNYLVLLVYFGPNDSSYGPWTSCQEFPTSDDVNKIGPMQIKWENIRNSNGVIPNYVVIIPIQGY
ncbi:MAG: hypothetical protein Q8K40_02940, partial [Ignavibacteria bacterium]|nr:hypothetical protein [Ignavibacteria bacterium]